MIFYISERSNKNFVYISNSLFINFVKILQLVDIKYLKLSLKYSGSYILKREDNGHTKIPGNETIVSFPLLYQLNFFHYLPIRKYIF